MDQQWFVQIGAGYYQVWCAALDLLSELVHWMLVVVTMVHQLAPAVKMVNGSLAHGRVNGPDSIGPQSDCARHYTLIARNPSTEIWRGN